MGGEGVAGMVEGKRGGGFGWSRRSSPVWLAWRLHSLPCPYLTHISFLPHPRRASLSSVCAFRSPTRVFSVGTRVGREGGREGLREEEEGKLEGEKAVCHRHTVLIHHTPFLPPFPPAFLFLRTGSLLPCVLTHSFCNLMGLPNLAFLLPPPSLLPPPPSSFILHAHRGKILGVYALGIGLFAILLYPCSDPQWYYREEGTRPLYWR